MQIRPFFAGAPKAGISGSDWFRVKANPLLWFRHERTARGWIAEMPPEAQPCPRENPHTILGSIGAEFAMPGGPTKGTRGLSGWPCVGRPARLAGLDQLIVMLLRRPFSPLLDMSKFAALEHVR